MGVGNPAACGPPWGCSGGGGPVGAMKAQEGCKAACPHPAGAIRHVHRPWPSSASKAQKRAQSKPSPRPEPRAVHGHPSVSRSLRLGSTRAPLDSPSSCSQRMNNGSVGTQPPPRTAGPPRPQFVIWPEQHSTKRIARIYVAVVCLRTSAFQKLSAYAARHICSPMHMHIGRPLHK